MTHDVIHWKKDLVVQCLFSATRVYIAKQSLDINRISFHIHLHKSLYARWLKGHCVHLSNISCVSRVMWITEGCQDDPVTLFTVFVFHNTNIKFASTINMTSCAHIFKLNAKTNYHC